ncbi:MAG: hypothetical protein WED09_03085 [Homoserinimonas sp.]
MTLGEAENGTPVTLDDLGRGVHNVRATFVPGDDTVTGSTSTREWGWVVF